MSVERRAAVVTEATGRLARREFILATVALPVLAGDVWAQRVSLPPVPSRLIQVPPAPQQSVPPVVTAARLDPNGSWLVLAGDDQTVRVWDVQADRQIRVLSGHRGWIDSVDIAADGQQLATASTDGRLILWALPTGRRLVQLQHASAVGAVRFSHDGSRLAVADFDPRITLYEVSSGRQIVQCRSPCRDLRTIAYSTDDSTLVTGGLHGWIALYQADQLRPIRSWQGHRRRVRAAVFDKSDRQVVSGGDDRQVKVWNVADASLAFALPPVGGRITDLVSLPNRHVAASCTDNLVRVWDLERRELVSELAGHAGTVTTLDCTGDWLVSAGFDATVRLWSLRGLERVIAEAGTRSRPLQPEELRTVPTSLDPVR